MPKTGVWIEACLKDLAIDLAMRRAGYFEMFPINKKPLEKVAFLQSFAHTALLRIPGPSSPIIITVVKVFMIVKVIVIPVVII